MSRLVGIDEAGYGPNLGPLVIVATVWQVPDRGDTLSALAQLSDWLESARGRDPRLVVADSKEIYKPKDSLARLEQIVLAFLGQNGLAAESLRELVTVLDPLAPQGMEALPWYRGWNERLPVAAEPATVSQLRTLVQECPVRLERVQARVLFPAEFNRNCRDTGSKGLVLSEASLKLLAQAVDAPMPEAPAGPLFASPPQNVSRETIWCNEPILAICDKHGGRNTYAALLEKAFAGHVVHTLQEGRAESRYELAAGDFPLDVRFCCRGEQYPTVALASMIAKYARELFMRAFNAFWATEVPGIKPTAGYPVDARRFLNDIQDRQAALGISQDLLWRCK